MPNSPVKQIFYVSAWVYTLLFVFLFLSDGESTSMISCDNQGNNAGGVRALSVREVNYRIEVK